MDPDGDPGGLGRTEPAREPAATVVGHRPDPGVDDAPVVADVQRVVPTLVPDAVAHVGDVDGQLEVGARLDLGRCRSDHDRRGPRRLGHGGIVPLRMEIALGEVGRELEDDGAPGLRHPQELPEVVDGDSGRHVLQRDVREHEAHRAVGQEREVRSVVGPVLDAVAELVEPVGDGHHRR